MAEHDFTPSPGPTNLASLPREEALQRARIAGREILGDSDAIQSVADTIWLKWLNVNAPSAVGQSDDEFAAFVDSMCDEFFSGISEGSEHFRSTNEAARPSRLLARINDLLDRKTALAWKLHNTLAFMVEAVPDDSPDGLPVHCALVDLRHDMAELATSLGGLMTEARHE